MKEKVTINEQKIWWTFEKWWKEKETKKKLNHSNYLIPIRMWLNLYGDDKENKDEMRSRCLKGFGFENYRRHRNV